MGTNFYWIDTQDHIGKRSAAGWYCWDCHKPFTKDGKKEFVHSSDLSLHIETCPVCGTGKIEQTLETSAAGIELGFSKPKTERLTHGVSTVSSFSFDMNIEIVQGRCNRFKDKEIIEDEYGRKLTGQQFTDMLACNCPIQFTDSIGRNFS